MKKLCLISVMVICGLLCFAPLAFCVVYIKSIEFDSDSGNLYGIVLDESTYKFVSINLSTGLLTAINSNIGSQLYYFHRCGTAINPTAHILYAIRTGDGIHFGYDYILSINTQTGAVTVSPAFHF